MKCTLFDPIPYIDYFRFVLILLFAFSVLGQEEVPKVEEPETQVGKISIS